MKRKRKETREMRVFVRAALLRFEVPLPALLSLNQTTECPQLFHTARLQWDRSRTFRLHVGRSDELRLGRTLLIGHCPNRFARSPSHSFRGSASKGMTVEVLIMLGILHTQTYKYKSLLVWFINDTPTFSCVSLLLSIASVAILNLQSFRWHTEIFSSN